MAELRHRPAGLRFSPLKQIRAGNVSRLRRVWTWHTGVRQQDRIIAFESTPLAIDGPVSFDAGAIDCRARKQFVVIAAGGGGYFAQPGADALAAYALPD